MRETVAWSCCMVCQLCRMEVYCYSGDMTATYDGDEHLAKRGQILDEAFTAYRVHANDMDHHVGGELQYHDNRVTEQPPRCDMCRREISHSGTCADCEREIEQFTELARLRAGIGTPDALADYDAARRMILDGE